MFHNSRKTIGVFLERSAGEFQNRLCQGIITEAKELGYNVAVLSDYGNYGQNHRYFIGDQTLWELPPYEELDGVVLAFDTMEEIVSREHVIKNIRERCHCPIVSIRELLVGANNLLVDNSSCMEGLIDHFVKEHGMKKLCFMTGPKDHWDAQERLLCFKRKMDEYGLSYGEHQIFYGDFWKNKGKEACDWFLAEGEPQPEGIICANDYMATAVASELIRRGYRIPQDIAVSGYDGMRSTLSFTPCITTATVPFFEMGRRAVQIIDKKQDCPEKVENVFFDAVLQPRESCGCMASEGQEVMTIRQRMYETENISQNREMQFHFMSIHMSECHTIDEVAQKIGRYIYNIEGFKDYCMCLCEGWLEKKEFKGFTDKMEMPIAIRNRENISPTRERFDRRELIPKCMSSEEPQMWFLVSLHFQDLCFGYEALQFIDVETTGRLYMYWNIIIGNLLQDIMTYQKMQKLVVKLEEMYDRDSLTGMYNRRGFENRGNPMFEQAKEEGKQIFLAIIDMDGMKQINDNYGHIEGDYALKKVREAIHHACPDAVIQARTGGDEFEIIAEDIAENEGVHYLEELVAYLDAFNESGGKEYDIHASYGYACRVPSQQDTMEIFIKESDEIMYRNKVINKINRGEALR